MTDVFSWLRGLVKVHHTGDKYLIEPCVGRLWPLALDPLQQAAGWDRCVFCAQGQDAHDEDCSLAAFFAAAERERGET